MERRWRLDYYAGFRFLALVSLCAGFVSNVIALILVRTVSPENVPWETVLTTTQARHLWMDSIFYLLVLLLCGYVAYWAVKRCTLPEIIFWVLLFAYYLVLAVLECLEKGCLGLLLIIDTLSLLFFFPLHFIIRRLKP